MNEAKGVVARCCEKKNSKKAIYMQFHCKRILFSSIIVRSFVPSNAPNLVFRVRLIGLTRNNLCHAIAFIFRFWFDYFLHNSFFLWHSFVSCLVNKPRRNCIIITRLLQLTHTHTHKILVLVCIV